MFNKQEQYTAKNEYSTGMFGILINNSIANLNKNTCITMTGIFNANSNSTIIASNINTNNVNNIVCAQNNTKLNINQLSISGIVTENKNSLYNFPELNPTAINLTVNSTAGFVNTINNQFNKLIKYQYTKNIDIQYSNHLINNGNTLTFGLQSLGYLMSDAYINSIDTELINNQLRNIPIDLNNHNLIINISESIENLIIEPQLKFINRFSYYKPA